MEKIFEVKVAIVTGGSFGIGRAAAIACYKSAKVVVADCFEDKEQNTLKQIESCWGQALILLHVMFRKK